MSPLPRIPGVDDELDQADNRMRPLPTMQEAPLSPDNQTQPDPEQQLINMQQDKAKDVANSSLQKGDLATAGKALIHSNLLDAHEARQKPQYMPRIVDRTDELKSMPEPAAPLISPQGAALPKLAEPTGETPAYTGMKRIGAGTVGEKALIDQRQDEVNHLKYIQAHGTREEAANAQEQLSRLETGTPWGSPSNHPSTLGKIGHVLAEVGNIAGNVFAPEVMAGIPGSSLNRSLKKYGAEGELKELGAEKLQEAQVEGTKNKAEVAQQKAQLEQQKANETAEKNTRSYENELRKHGLKPGSDGQPPVPLTYAEMSPTEQGAYDLRAAQTEVQESRAALEKLKADPSSPEYQLQVQRLKTGQQNAANAAARLGLSEKQFENKLQEQQLVKPSGQAQSRGSSANAALDLLPGLIEDVRKNGAEFGPIMGRINRGEISLGSVDPEIQRVYSELKSFYALQPSVHGFRNAEFVKDFDSIIGNLQTNPKAVIAGLQGVAPTLRSVAKEGVTYHKRQVEGKTESKPESPFAAWKKSQK